MGDLFYCWFIIRRLAGDEPFFLLFLSVGDKLGRVFQQKRQSPCRTSIYSFLLDIRY